MSTIKAMSAPTQKCSAFKTGARAKHYRGWSTGFTFGGRACFFFAPSKSDLSAIVEHIGASVPLPIWSEANFQHIDVTSCKIADVEAAMMRKKPQ